jgi:glycosyltransferase involved in cell wall biosynthesis
VPSQTVTLETDAPARVMFDMDGQPRARRPRVLVLDHTAQEGGAELALVRLVGALRDAVELRVLLFADGPLRERLSAAGAQVAVLPLDQRIATARRDGILAGAGRSALGAARFVPRLVRAIRGSGAELVVATSLKSAVFACVAAPLAGRRWVWHLHDRLAPDYLPAPLAAGMRMLAVLGPRVIVANSRATLATLPASARRKAVIAYPGLPAEAFAPVTVPAAPPVVGIIGRVSPTKGQREFLGAASIVARSRPDVRFRVVGGALFGEDDYEAELRDRAAALGLGDRVEFTGWVDDVAVRLRELTVLVHASPVPEPFGQVIVEAMAAGVPVIAAAAGGVPEILDPRGARSTAGWRRTALGVLVEPGDPAAIASAVDALLDDPAGRARTAATARADAERRFGIERTAEIVLSAWRRTPRLGGVERSS